MRLWGVAGDAHPVLAGILCLGGIGFRAGFCVHRVCTVGVAGTSLHQKACGDPPEWRFFVRVEGRLFPIRRFQEFRELRKSFHEIAPAVCDHPGAWLQPAQEVRACAAYHAPAVNATRTLVGRSANGSAPTSAWPSTCGIGFSASTVAGISTTPIRQTLPSTTYARAPAAALTARGISSLLADPATALGRIGLLRGLRGRKRANTSGATRAAISADTARWPAP
jgi:hypothetical protein